MSFSETQQVGRALKGPPPVLSRTLSEAAEIEDIPMRPVGTRVGSSQELRARRAPVTDDTSTHIMYGSEPNPEAFPDGGFAANVVLFGAFVGLIADFGIANSMGAVQSYIATHQLKDVEATTVSWIFTIHLGVMYFGGVFFGALFDWLGAKPPLMAGTVVIGAGLLLTAESQSVVHFIMSFGVLTAVGTSVAMSPLIGALSHWYLKRRAMACSIATIGGLVGASVFPVMLQHLYQVMGFKWALRVLAFVCMGCMAVSIVLVRERGARDELEEAVEVEESARSSVRSQEGSREDPSEGSSEVPSEGSTSRREGTPAAAAAKFDVVAAAKTTVHFLRNALDFSILRDSRFVFLTIAVALAELVSVSTMTFFSFYALGQKVPESQAYLLLTVINVSGIPSRLVSGILADSYGRFNVMLASSILTTVLVFAVWLPGGANVQVLFAFAALFGISTSAVISLIPACTGQICAADRFGKVYGTLYFFLGFITVLGMMFASMVIGGGSGVSLRNFVLYEGAASVASVVMWVSARHSAVGWKLCKF